MNFIWRLLRRLTGWGPVFPVTVRINAKILPLTRSQMFQAPLTAALEAAGLGKSSDAGTQCSKENEILYCDVEVDLYERSERAFWFVKETVEALGCPKGSALRIDWKDVRPLGMVEGLGLYLNGTDLPDEVYANSDIDVVFEEIEKRIAGAGRLLGDWRSPTEFALYLYGASFEELNARIADFVATYPLCRKCRIVQIA